MVQRVTYRRRKAYNTRSNQIRKVKTPGGILAVQYLAKKTGKTICGDCKCQINGVKNVRPFHQRALKKREKTVSRAYGGSRCHGCVRERIVRAFLIEEQKIVKHLRSSKAAKKSSK